MFSSDSIFSRFMNKLADILLIGILWLLCSLPLVTIGAAATAAYYAMAKCVRHNAGYVTKEFFYALKTNFKQSLPMTGLFIVSVLVLGVDFYYVWNNESSLNSALFVILILIAFLILGLPIFLWPVLSRFQKKNMELIKMAGILMSRYLPVTICMLILFLASCIGVYLMPWAVLVIPGVYVYVWSFPMEKIMKKIMPPVDETSEEAQKWYYQ